MELLPGTLEKLWAWDARGHKIILTTARKESLRARTERELEELGIIYDQLIMGLTSGPRYLINDVPDGHEGKKAIEINLPRNQGIRGVEI